MKKPNNDFVVEPKSNLPTGKENSDFESDSESEVDSNSESDQESSQESEFESELDNKEAFRNLYVAFHRHLGMYSRLVQILDKLKMMNCITQEECNTTKETIQTAIGFSEDDKIDDPDKLVEEFENLTNELRHNLEIYNKLVQMLDDMLATSFLTKEECSVAKEYLRKKLAL